MNNSEYQLAILILLIDESINQLDNLLKFIEPDKKRNSNQIYNKNKIKNKLLELKIKINNHEKHKV